MRSSCWPAKWSDVFGRWAQCATVIHTGMIERLQLQQLLDSLFKEVDIRGLFFVSLLESASDIAIAIDQNDVGDIEFWRLWRYTRNVVEYH